MDEVTVALLEASKKLREPNSTTSSSCTNIPSLTLTFQHTSSTTSSSSLLSTSSSPAPSPVQSSSVATSPSSPSLLNSIFSGIRRCRTVSESHISSGATVKVDLSPWLAEGNHARELKVARVRRNSNREIEEAMSGGLSKADVFMPPI